MKPMHRNILIGMIGATVFLIGILLVVMTTERSPNEAEQPRVHDSVYDKRESVFSASLQFSPVEDIAQIVAWLDETHFLYTRDIDNIVEYGNEQRLYIYNLSTESSLEIPEIRALDWWGESLVHTFKGNNAFGVIGQGDRNAYSISTVTFVGKVRQLHSLPENVKVYGDFSPDGRWYVGTTMDGDLFKIDVERDTYQRMSHSTFAYANGYVESSFHALSFSPDGTKIILEQWIPPEEAHVYHSHTEVILATLSADADSLDSLREVGRSFIIETEGQTTFQWSEDSRYVIHSWSGNIFDTETAKTIMAADDSSSDTRIIPSLFAPSLADTSRVLQYVFDGPLSSLEYVDIHTKKGRHLLGPSMSAPSAVWANDGRSIVYIISGTNPNRIEQMNIETGEISVLVASDRELSGLIFSPSGKRAAYLERIQGQEVANNKRVRLLEW